MKVVKSKSQTKTKKSSKTYSRQDNSVTSQLEKLSSSMQVNPQVKNSRLKKIKSK